MRYEVLRVGKIRIEAEALVFETVVWFCVVDKIRLQRDCQARKRSLVWLIRCSRRNRGNRRQPVVGNYAFDLQVAGFLNNRDTTVALKIIFQLVGEVGAEVRGSKIRVIKERIDLYRLCRSVDPREGITRLKEHDARQRKDRDDDFD